MIKLIANLINNIGYLILIGFIVSRTNSFRRIIQKDNYKLDDLIILSMIFGGFGIISTYLGTDINGAIASIRVINIMAGGILCGPFVGIASGLIAGIHRLLVDIHGITTIPCAVTTITSGFLSGLIYKKIKDNYNARVYYELIGGIFMETLEVILILIISKPYSTAVDIVKSIYIPMGLTNTIGVPILVSFIRSIFDEKEQIAAKQAKLALDIANKTLPYFRDVENGSYDKVCEIIKESINADAVAITNREYLIAHTGIGADHHIKGERIQTKSTEKVINSGEILTLKNKEEINCPNKDCQLKSAIVVPLKDGQEVIGALKIYYSREDAISYRNKNLAIGLSQIISTQFQISKLGKLQEMATKAEIRALQTQINPHFLFNALNTIISFIRIDPNKARELIINLSTYLRYNLDIGDKFVDIYKELEQVKAYVEIEKARFGDKLNVVYDVDENINVKIPSLIIQPIVENSIKHGILPTGNAGTVKISIKKINSGKAKIVIEDDGIGIPDKIIEDVHSNSIQKNKIGISNVNNRLIYIYGKGLEIERLNKGTRTTFQVQALEG